MVSRILKIVCSYYGISKYELTTKCTKSSQTISIAKQTAAHFLWDFGGLTNEQITEELGYEDKSSSIKNRNTVLKVLTADRAYQQAVYEMEMAVRRRKIKAS